MHPPSPVAYWHRIVEQRDPAQLADLLAEEVVFYSPVVFTPQKGKALTTAYLSAALHVLGNDQFRYVSETIDARRAVLEFETEINGIFINGIDMFTWNSADQIDTFKVMVRPLQAINLLHQLMMEMLKGE